jgi:cytidine deaminase
MNDTKLYELAQLARKNSYSPYSGFAVGAALLTASGKVYTGCNVENASYGATICAERNAVFSAVADGERALKKIAIAGSTEAAAYPCGICRQVMSEFAADDFYVIVCENGKLLTFTLEELLPHSFALKN